MSQYLDRNQVIELYANYQPSLANHVYEFGEKLMALPIVKIPIAELDTTNDFAEWVKFTLEGGFLSSHKCSNCGFHGNQLWHYCPNCGADMRTPCQKCEYGYLKECDITCDVRKEGEAE